MAFTLVGFPFPPSESNLAKVSIRRAYSYRWKAEAWAKPRKKALDDMAIRVEESEAIELTLLFVFRSREFEPPHLMFDEAARVVQVLCELIGVDQERFDTINISCMKSDDVDGSVIIKLEPIKRIERTHIIATNKRSPNA